MATVARRHSGWSWLRGGTGEDTSEAEQGLAPDPRTQHKPNSQAEHNQAFGWADFFPTFLASTFKNWQSEWLQLAFQAILLLGAKHLIFRVDAEDMERLEAKVDKINRQLEDRQHA